MPATSLGLTYPDSTGHVRLWEHIQALADTVNAVLLAPVTLGAWTTFTLTTAGSTNITIGNATQSCAYRLRDNKTAEFRILLTLGSTTVLSGAVGLGPLPFTCLGSTQVGSAWWYRSSANMRNSIANMSGTQVLRIIPGANFYWDNTQPAAYATSDQVMVNAVVELA